MRCLLLSPLSYSLDRSICYALNQLGIATRLYAYDEVPLIEKVTNKLLRMANKLSEERMRKEKKINKNLIKNIKEFDPDLLFVIKGEGIWEETLKRLKGAKKALKTAIWFNDNLNKVDMTNLRNNMGYYDHIFTYERDDVLKWQALGAADVKYLPVGYGPEIFGRRKLNDREKKIYGGDLSFVGAPYEYRREIFKRLAGYNYKLKVWGAQWLSNKNRIERLCIRDKFLWALHRKAFGGEAAKIYNATKININLYHGSAFLQGINNRTFEILGSGGFEIVDNNRDIGEFYEIGKEIIVFKDFDDLVSLVDYYLVHPEERRKITQRGYQRTISEHTFFHRMKTMLNFIF